MTIMDKLPSEERLRKFLSISSNGLVIGKLVDASNPLSPKVDFTGNPNEQPLTARTTVLLDAASSSMPVALLFEQGDPLRPVVIGPVLSAENTVPETLEAAVDGEHVCLEGEQEVVLKCGKASITLTKAGKIILRGAYISSRSSGANRIKGASVQIN